MKVNKAMKRSIVPGPTAPRAHGAGGFCRALGLAAAATGCSSTDLLADGGSSADSGGGAVQATFTSLYGDYLGNCKQCHAPGAPGQTSDIEQSLNFASRATALSTLMGMASGLTGNHTACNGVPFLAATPGSSLLVASLDQPTRQAFDLSGHVGCDVDSISDQTVKVGSQPSSAFISALKTWITNGAPDN